MPFGRFPGADTVLGPEMKSTGEVMGIARNFPAAFAKTQLAISYALPEGGTVFISRCATATSAPSCPSPATSCAWASTIVATAGTARTLRCGRRGRARRCSKIHEGAPNVCDMIADGEIALHGQHPLRPRHPRRRLRAAHWRP